MSTDGLEISACTAGEALEAVRVLLQRYWGSFGFPRDFQGFDQELRTLPGRYAPPDGVLLLARLGRDAAGRIGFRRLGPQLAEAKRLFVADEHRGRGSAARCCAS